MDKNTTQILGKAIEAAASIISSWLNSSSNSSKNINKGEL